MTAAAPYLIRPVLPAEHDALGELTVQAYIADGLLPGGLGNPYAEHLRDVAHRAAEALVLVAVGPDGVLLGGVTLALPGSPLAEIAGPGEAEIRMLAVGPQGRGRGAGTALAAACVDRSREAAGIKRIVLGSKHAMVTAHRIYTRLGFERAPELDWEPVPDVPLWAFRLELD